METTTMPISKSIVPTMVKPSALKYDASIVEARKRRAEQEARRKTAEHNFKEGMRVAVHLQKRGKVEMAKNVREGAFEDVRLAGFYVKVTNGAMEVK